MKKNSTMRIAALLLVLTLMTSCFVGGTFAKYTTGDSGSDSARVAKWGVTASVTGGAFAKEYTIEDSDAAAGVALAVKSDTANPDRVVAPGTDGTFTGVALTGTPEVAVEITKTATITLSGWELSDGTFYCPITITINSVPYCGLDYDSAANFIADLKNGIEAANGYYEPLTDLSGIAGMNGDYTWKWEFEGATGTEINQSNLYDTYLGNQEASFPNTNTIAIAVSVLVEQVD